MNKTKLNREKLPLVSIIMSTYNDGIYIDRAIESVLNQTYQNWEFIIIDDASTDITLKVLKDYAKQEKRIKLIRNKENKGLTENLNIGIIKSKGKYIARIDGDDAWINKEKLAKQIKFFIKNPSYSLVGCYANAIDSNDKKVFEIAYPSEDNEIRKIMLRHSCFVHSAVVYTKESLKKVDYYNPEYAVAQDYDLYLKIGEISKFYNIPEFLVNYRINPSGTSRTKYFEQMEQMVKIINKHKGYYPNYALGLLMWSLRKYYPVWFRGALSREIKKIIAIN